MSRFLAVAAGMAVSALAGDVGAASFHEVRERVYEKPLRVLPQYEVGVLRSIVDALTFFGGELIERGRATLVELSDFKPKAPKIIHTYGVCAEATWKIDRSSTATGLLSPLSVTPLVRPAMVRISIATTDTTYRPGKRRHFGMAVKVFPSANERAPVVTRNVFTLDQTGLTGDVRPSFFFPNAADAGPIFFTNSVTGTGFLSWLGQRTFEKLDSPSDFRSLYPLTETGPEGERIARPSTPRLIRFYPRMKPGLGIVPSDFRHELMQYGPGEIRFEIALPVQNGIQKEKVIGSLVLGRPVMSESCDLELTFHHAPEERLRPEGEW